MRLILAKILWNFDLSLEKESENWINHKMHIVWVKSPLMVRLKPVERDDAVKMG